MWVLGDNVAGPVKNRPEADLRCVVMVVVMLGIQDKIPASGCQAFLSQPRSPDIHTALCS